MKIVSQAFIILVVSFLPAINCFSQDDSSTSLMFYNVENLFDTVDDSTTVDEEFLPNGTRRWSRTRYWHKINAIYKVIAAAGEWSPPALIGLCEIENRYVLESLVNSTNLKSFDYGIVHEESSDPRGIDVGLLYRRDMVKIIGHEKIVPYPSFTSRDVLYVKCELFDDTLHLFLNHWPSRRGGVMAAQDTRDAVAGIVRHKIDSLAVADGMDTKIIVVGDFNISFDDDMMTGFVKGGDHSLPLVNMVKRKKVGEGSYKYQGKWEIIDQIIVSKALLDAKEGVSTSSNDFSIFSQPFMLVKDENNSGQRPFSTWWGYKYTGGYSDHLPVMLKLHRKKIE